MRFFFFALMIFCLAATDDATAKAPEVCAGRTPLPSDVAIAMPGPEVPAEIAAFSGAWVGTWSAPGEADVLCQTLVVEEVHANGFVQAIDSTDAYPAWRINAPRQRRIIGRVEDGVLSLRVDNLLHKITRSAEGGLFVEAGENATATLRAAKLADIGCSTPVAEPAFDDRRRHLTASQMMSAASVPDGSSDAVAKGPLHNRAFRPIGPHGPAAQAFNGTLHVAAGTYFVSAEGCPGDARELGAFSLSFFSQGGHLVPAERGIQGLSEDGRGSDLIVGPGRVWFEHGDGGLSRASFPFEVISQLSNETHNGLATFLYDKTRVSGLRIQIVKETASWNRYDAWGALTMRYEPRVLPNEAALRQAFAAEVADAIEIRPWSDLRGRLDPLRLHGFLGAWGREYISAAGLVESGRLYLHDCRSRYGPYPYCRQMRHAAFSLTKSMGAAVALLRLAQIYGPEVFETKVADYLNIDAGHDGWDEVRFADLLNMSAGIGNEHPQPKPPRPMADGTTPAVWFQALSAGDKLRAGFAHYGDLPWGPGEVMRYNTTHTFVLAAAMQAFLKAKQGPQADIWRMLQDEVLRPIGIHHLPIMRSVEADGSLGTPIFGSGAYPTVEDVAKIATLLQNGGRHAGRQLLHPGKLAEALYRGDNDGLPTGFDNRFGAGRYQLSFWGLPYGNGKGCSHILPYMSGYGGNSVLLLPNGVTALRFSDSHNLELEPLTAAADALAPLCRRSATDTVTDPADDRPPLTAAALRAHLVGNTFYYERWNFYPAPSGHIYAASDDSLLLGRWRIDPSGHFCTRYATWRGGAENCYRVFARADDAFEMRPFERWNDVALRRVAGNPEDY